MATVNYSTQFSTSEKPQSRTKTTTTNTAMNILFIGNMAATKQPASIINIDRDNFEDIMNQLGIQIELNITDSTEKLIIPIKELDDFQPDTIFQRLEIFQRLKQLRRQLQNSDSFQAAASEIQGWLVEAPENTQQESIASNDIETDKDSNLLDSILDSSHTSRSVQQPASLVDQLIKEVIRPYITEASDPNKNNYIQAVDNAVGEQMRKILHHPYFQEIESAWQDLYFLVRKLETDSQLKIFLMHASKNFAEQKLRDTIDQQPDFNWGSILAHYNFYPNIIDVETLTTLGNMGEECQAPILAAADSSFVGVNSFDKNSEPEDWGEQLDHSFEQQWNNLRDSQAAHYIALVSPRFLLRYPYGKNSASVSYFSFEELSSPPLHEQFLWGNAATLLIYMIAQAYTRDGWQLNANEFNRISGLPAHYYVEDNEKVLKPCAEINLTSRGGEKMTSKGIIPIFSVLNEDGVQTGKLCSIASDRLLKGRWN